MKPGQKIAIVQTTVCSIKEARKLSALILGKRLGACLQIMPIESHYHWRGKKESASETLVSVKTRSSLAVALAKFIQKHHAYELPEIIITRVTADATYAKWVAEETKQARTYLKIALTK